MRKQTSERRRRQLQRIKPSLSRRRDPKPCCSISSTFQVQSSFNYGGKHGR